MSSAPQGYVEPGFGAVADAFRKNFAELGDSGAACSVVIDGRNVVDIYAGYARDGAPWTPSTRSVVFSTSKGVTALCLLMAAEQGHLDLDEPVATYWPEFAQHGKHAVTVRQMLAHRAGLLYPERDLTPEDLAAWTPVADTLAAQAPLWHPNQTFAYHPITIGFLAGEVLRRTTGLRPSEWLSRYIAGPLDLRMTFGSDSDDLAPIIPPTTTEAAPYSPEELVMALKAMTMSGAYDPDLFAASNTPAFLGLESPGVNLVTTAHDLARMYAAIVGEVDGVRLLGDETIRLATQPLSEGMPFIGEDEGNIWATGYMLHSRRRQMAGEGSFGHDGAGGQLAFASLRHRLGFAYQTVQAAGQSDPRAELLSAALRRCL